MERNFYIKLMKSISHAGVVWTSVLLIAVSILSMEACRPSEKTTQAPPSKPSAQRRRAGPYDTLTVTAFVTKDTIRSLDDYALGYTITNSSPDRQGVLLENMFFRAYLLGPDGRWVSGGELGGFDGIDGRALISLPSKALAGRMFTLRCWNFGLEVEPPACYDPFTIRQPGRYKFYITYAIWTAPDSGRKNLSFISDTATFVFQPSL